MSTPDEILMIQQRLRTDDDFRRRARERIRASAYPRGGRWYAGPARVRVDSGHETRYEPPQESFATREEAEDFARAYVLQRLQDTTD